VRVDGPLGRGSAPGPGLDRFVQERHREMMHVDRETMSSAADELYAAGGPKRALVAEDDEEMRRLVSVYLKAAGLDVEEVRDGLELLSRLRDRSAPVDLLVTDVHMPRMNGLEAIRRAGCVARVPTIVITSFGDERLHAEARSLGAVVVLDKPFDLDELIDAVTRIVDAVDEEVA